MINKVGLFGTCGDSKWREEIAIPLLEKNKVDYFNPVVKNWNEEAQRNEADNMSKDKVLLIVITDETSGITSMAETGWMGIMSILKDRPVVIVLQECDEFYDNNNVDLRINNTRKLIMKYYNEIKKISNPPIYVYNDIVKGVNKSIELMKED